MSAQMELLDAMLAPVVQATGVELYDIELLREGGERILRLYIDKPEGIDLDDCERVSHATEAVLDEHDPISGAYSLEVSSPGIERKLTRDAHFTRFVGSKIQVKLFAPIEKRKNFTGTLIGYENNVITLHTEPEREMQFPRDAVAKCRLVVFED